MTPEEWCPVGGLEGLYEVSNQGRVRSVARRLLNPGGCTTRVHKSQILALTTAPGRPVRVALRKRLYVVGVLVLEAFGKPRPAGCTVPAYADGNPDNLALENLSWAKSSPIRWKQFRG